MPEMREELIETPFEPDDIGYPPDPTDEEYKKRPKIQHGPKRGESARTLTAERHRRALELRKAGLTYHAIAQQLGYADLNGARSAVMKAMENVVVEPAKELRIIQYERCNHMLMILWPKVQAGEERAMQQALALMDKMDRLMGTEQPMKQEIDINMSGGILVVDGNTEDYVAAMKRMAGYVDDMPELPSGNVDSDIIDAVIVEPEPVTAKKRRPTKA